MRYILDTGVVLHMARNSTIWLHTATQFDLLHPDARLYISVMDDLANEVVVDTVLVSSDWTAYSSGDFAEWGARGE